MRIVALIFAACAPLACGPDNCDQLSDSDATGSELVEEIARAECCHPIAEGTICESHPFGRATACGKALDPPVQEPQTTENCVAVATRNPGLCAEAYVLCREAIRVAACDACPPECEGIIGACDL